MVSLRINKALILIFLFSLLLSSVGFYYQNKLDLLTIQVDKLSSEVQTLSAITNQHTKPVAIVSGEQVIDPGVIEKQAKVREIVWELLSAEKAKANDAGFSIFSIETVDERQYDPLWGIAHWAYFSAESGFIGWDLVVEDCKRYMDGGHIDEDIGVLLEALIEVML